MTKYLNYHDIHLIFTGYKDANNNHLGFPDVLGTKTYTHCYEKT